jgi:hypothetical protein
LTWSVRARVDVDPVLAAGRDAGRAADLAALEKTHQQDIAATVSRDPVAPTEVRGSTLFRIGVGQPAEAFCLVMALTFLYST